MLRPKYLLFLICLEMYHRMINAVNQCPNKTAVVEFNLHCMWKWAFTVKGKKGGGISRSDGVTHHILPGVLPRRNEHVGPGQGQKQRQRNHVELKVPNDDDKKLLKDIT